MPLRRLFKDLATACRSNKHTRVHTQWHTRARTHTFMFGTPPHVLCSYLVHTIFNTNCEVLGRSVWAKWSLFCFSLRSDACTCCCETEGRRLQSTPSDVLSAHWTVHGHSRPKCRYLHQAKCIFAILVFFAPKAPRLEFFTYVPLLIHLNGQLRRDFIALQTCLRTSLTCGARWEASRTPACSYRIESFLFPAQF
jgi:hypothetical protein